MNRIKKIDIEIENSISLRISILYLVIISILTIWYFLELSLSYIFLALFFTILGFIVSYIRRNKRNLILKILMTIAMIYLLREFFRNLISQPFDPRIPLAVFLINLNALHSFDLPTRVDLSFSFFISIILMVISGVFARESIFVIFFLFYFLGLVITLILLNYQRLQVKYFLCSILSISFIGFLIFPILPRNLPIRFRQDIMSQVINRITSFRGEIRVPNANTSNYYLYRLPEGRNISPMPYDPENYFGFAPFVDLRQRGSPSSALAFRVLTSFPTYHRGLAFDTYNGFGWYQKEEKINNIYTDMQPFILSDSHLPEEGLFRATYFIERDTGNIIFAPSGTLRLYFPAPFIYKDNEEGLRSPFDLPKNLIYTSFFTDTVIRSSKKLLLAKIPDKNKFQKYLQLPNLSERVKKLTLDITKHKETPWEKLIAIENYLKENYPYSLDIPPLKENVDAVEDFLFITKKGYCEQFATTFAVMARIIGIPSRFITGFTPGELNPWTGMYEVRVKNAHAWVEVYLEGVGWIPIDPTPGVDIIEILEKKESPNFLGIIVSTFDVFLEEIMNFLFHLSTLHLYIFSILFLFLILYIIVKIVRRYRMTKEDRVYIKVMNSLKKRGLIKAGKSPYEMVKDLDDEVKEFVSIYYALKFAELTMEQKREYRDKLIKMGKILKSKSFSLFPTNGQGLNKNL
jgi:transglutaminase-like putative cysteine protease